MRCQHQEHSLATQLPCFLALSLALGIFCSLVQFHGGKDKLETARLHSLHTVGEHRQSSDRRARNYEGRGTRRVGCGEHCDSACRSKSTTKHSYDYAERTGDRVGEVSQCIV